MKKQEVLYGIHPVREAIQAGCRHIDTILLAPGKIPERLLRIQEMAVKKGIPVKTVPAGRLGALAKSDRHQGVVAETGIFQTTPLETLLKSIASGAPPPFLLVADSITDPMNLGALIRTALAVGMTAVITPRDRCAPPTPTVSNASAGALEHTTLVQVTNLARALGTLQERGIWIFGLDHRAEQDCYHSNFTGPAALVIGGEGKGIRPLVKKYCDHLVAIPQNGPVTSLNASVAGAVVMYEAYRQRVNVEHRTSNIE